MRYNNVTVIGNGARTSLFCLMSFSSHQALPGVDSSCVPSHGTPTATREGLKDPPGDAALKQWSSGERVRYNLHQITFGGALADTGTPLLPGPWKLGDNTRGSPMPFVGSCFNFFLPAKAFFPDGRGSTETHSVTIGSAWEVKTQAFCLNRQEEESWDMFQSGVTFWNPSWRLGCCELLLFFNGNLSPSSLYILGLRFETQAKKSLDSQRPGLNTSSSTERLCASE